MRMMILGSRSLILCAAIFVLSSVLGVAKDLFPGPVEADVVRVIDGDTFVAAAHIWPGQILTVSVRVRGIDAPEIRSRCAAEKAAGQKSRAALEDLLASGRIKIRNIGADKYFGRILADVMTADDVSVAEHLVARALARPYDGGRREGFCRDGD